MCVRVGQFAANTTLNSCQIYLFVNGGLQCYSWVKFKPGRNVTALQGSGRNVTMNNYFTGVLLVKTLLQRKLTIVGTMKKCKRKSPECMKPAKSRETKTSIFGFNDQLTMVSYGPQKNKAVIVLSTMHHEISIDEEDHKKKPKNSSVVL